VVQTEGAEVAQAVVVEGGHTGEVERDALLRGNDDLHCVAVPAGVTVALVGVIHNLHRVVDAAFIPRDGTGAGLVIDTVPDAAAVLVELTQGAARGRAGAIAAGMGVVGVEGDLGDVAVSIPVAEVTVQNWAPAFGIPRCRPDRVLSVPETRVAGVRRAEIGLLPRAEACDRLPLTDATGRCVTTEVNDSLISHDVAEAGRGSVATVDAGGVVEKPTYVLESSIIAVHVHRGASVIGRASSSACFGVRLVADGSVVAVGAVDPAVADGHRPYDIVCAAATSRGAVLRPELRENIQQVLDVHLPILVIVSAALRVTLVEESRHRKEQQG
jgi:hypothetical protein